MNFQNFLQLIGSVLIAISGGGVLVFALSGWLGKVWASRILERERTELQRITNEHNIRFSKLHDKQALLIGELYENLYKVDYAVRQVDYWISQTLLEPNKDWIAESSLKLTEELLTLRQHFEKNQIYFSESLCDCIQQILNSSSEISDEYFASIITTTQDDINEACRKASDIVKEKKELVDNGLQTLRKEFRKLLGVA